MFVIVEAKLSAKFIYFFNKSKFYMKYRRYPVQKSEICVLQLLEAWNLCMVNLRRKLPTTPTFLIAYSSLSWI